jgi:urea carboxylase
VQDWPGRVGHWDVGVPPSGPMDDLALRAANRIVGNEEGAPALELTLTGPTLAFHCESVIALTGAEMGATLDGEPIPRWQPIVVRKDAVLAIGMAETRGFRAYLAVRGGLDLPQYLGSTATFMLGRFGGHAGRARSAGGVFHHKN